MSAAGYNRRNGDVRLGVRDEHDRVVQHHDSVVNPHAPWWLERGPVRRMRLVPRTARPGLGQAAVADVIRLSFVESGVNLKDAVSGDADAGEPPRRHILTASCAAPRTAVSSRGSFRAALHAALHAALQAR